MLDRAFNGKRVLVTGHTGFKGSWLCTWLQLLGAEITGYALPPEPSQPLFGALGLERHVRHIAGDVRDFSHLQRVMDQCRPEYVFHLAAQAFVRASYANPKATFDVNVGGSVNVFEAVRATPGVRALVHISTDKCYRNREWYWGYRENDELGGDDPYSASKAATELALASYQRSFFRHMPEFRAASARAGNVIGGGDWSADRIVPDCVRALTAGEPIRVRNPDATRPWQHVLEPLYGYLVLAAHLCDGNLSDDDGGWNFGPDRRSNRTVRALVSEVIQHWGDGRAEYVSGGSARIEHEAGLLSLNCDKSFYRLAWQPRWSFEQAVAATIDWYRAHADGVSAWRLTTDQIRRYLAEASVPS